MARTLYAFLVGIDEYPAPIRSLSGCVNDVETFAEYLRQRVDGAQGISLELKMLRNTEATRDAVIGGFRQHLGQAAKGDIALFYYAGHGAQEQAPPEFWPLEPDKLNETLVCHDSRLDGGWDLADKELNKLIGEVTAKDPHMVLILDSCHSGSTFRDPAEQPTNVRLAQVDMRVRPLSSFIVSVEEAFRLAGPGGVAAGDGGVAAGMGRYIALSACRDNQLAQEYPGDNKPRGAFSYFLNETLRTAAGPISYRDLFSRASSLMQAKLEDQVPVLDAPSAGDLESLFLDGGIRPAEPAYNIAFRQGDWLLEAGAVHGLPKPFGNETIELALYPFDAAGETLRDRSKSVGKAKVTELRSTTSTLEISSVANLAEDMTFKAVVTRLPLPPMAVRIEGESAEGVALARAALAQAGPAGKGSLYIREVAGADTPEFRLLAQGGQYVIASMTSDRPLVGQLDGFSQTTAAKAIERLEHIARWTLTSRLSNPSTTIQPEEIDLQILQGDTPLAGPEIRLGYKVSGGKGMAPKFKIRVRNNGQRPLWIALLDLPQNYKVSTELQQTGSTRLEPGQEYSPFGGQEISATIPDEFWKLGVVEYKDILKLIVCTDEFDARLLAQPALDLPRTAPLRTRSSRGGSLDRLMARMQTRDLSPPEGDPDDWTTTMVTFTTVRPLDPSAIPADPQAALALPGGVKVKGHRGLKAKARLTTAPLASRDLGTFTLPAILGENPAVTPPFVLAATRSGDPGLSVLELTDVEPNSEALVTPQDPLRVEIPQQLAPGEHLLPIGFDGEFFLPLGCAVKLADGTTEVRLDRIPAPTVPGGTRSLTGSIRIFFQKVVSQVIGTNYPYPILAVADVDDNENLTSIPDPAKVKERVARAQRILLFVHGIIGDTRDMAKSVQRARLAEGGATLKSRYDLVLTFDYENLNTTIEQNARSLKLRLEAAGLGANHGKTLHIAAHSMGGLVSRWFIEREDGNQVVQKLVMLGTPNGGSPWPNVVDWGTATLALGLNHLTVIPWSGQVVSWLEHAIEQVKVDLGEMHAGSPVLKILADSPDPKIPYLMVAGNTSLPPQVVEPDPSKGNTSILQRLLKSLRAVKPLELAANQLFAGVANDIAVSQESMRTVPASHTPPYDVREVACDHLTYFNNPVGLDGLIKALW